MLCVMRLVLPTDNHMNPKDVNMRVAMALTPTDPSLHEVWSIGVINTLRYPWRVGHLSAFGNFSRGQSFVLTLDVEYLDRVVGKRCSHG